MHKYLLQLFFFLSASALNAQQTVGLFTRDPGSHDGYVLFAPNFSNNTYLIDKCGYEVHSWTSTHQPGQSAYLLDDGSLLRTGKVNGGSFNAGGSGGIFEKFDWNGTLLWSYTIASTTECQHHDIYKLPNGNVLAIVWELKTISEAMAAGRNPAAIGTVLWSEKIVEVQQTGINSGIVVWEWRVWDHLIQDFDSLKPNYGVVSQHPELINLNFTTGTATASDWLHCNAIDYNAELDQIVISSHNLSEIWIIDHSTTTAEAASHSGGVHGKGGDLLYRWGNPAVYGRGTGADKKFFGQHNVQWIRNGLKDAGKIMVFNNGIQRPAGNYSSIDIISQPVDSAGDYAIAANQPYQPDSAFWSYVAPVQNSFYSMNISGAQRLSNGNTLICEGASGNFFEIDSLKNTVWNYVNPVGQAGNIITQGAAATQNSVFRCTQYDPSYTGLTGFVLVPGNPIELNPLSYTCNMLTSIHKTENSQINIRVGSDFSGHLLLQSDADVKILTASLSDLTGKLINQWGLLSLNRNNDASLTVDHVLAPGIYLLHLKSIDADFTFKILR
jgi:hypothetical protein